MAVRTDFAAEPIRISGKAALILTAFLPACSGGTLPSGVGQDGNSPCPAHAAQILVFDGVLQTSCGCQEGAAITANPPQPLTCTIPTGSTVFFQYIGPNQTHQISPTNGTSFPPSPPYIPSSGNPVLTFTVVFNATGSYPFIDEYDAAMNGVIIVQ